LQQPPCTHGIGLTRPKLQIPADMNITTSGVNLELDEAPSVSPEPTFTLYNGPHEIDFTPEEALKQGLAMVEHAKRSIATLHIANEMRRDVWDRELQKLVTKINISHTSDILSSLQKTGAQKTMIALCGGICGFTTCLRPL
jgi:hypothetical protein